MVGSSFGSESSAWAEKTYEEIREVGEQAGAILTIPIGSVEQHGHHLPVATDTILVDAIAELGAQRVADELPFLRTPPVWTGFSPHHLSLGGAISLDFDVMLSVLEDVADTALDNGFDALLILNGHGGNMPLVSAAVSTIGEEHDDVEVLGLTYFQLANDFIDDIRESETGGMSHAGEFETSLMMYLRPELVDEDDRDASMLEEPYDLATQDLHDGGPLAVYREFEEYSATGAIGAPDLATAEKGEVIYESLGDELEALLREIHDRNR